MKEERGITLIALVITIIVLLILAGVTIATLTGDNGLLVKTTNAKMLTEIGEIEEKIRLKTLENENQQLIEGSLDSIGLNISENIIDKYKDIVYVKDSKLYLSFIANFPQTDLYKSNKDKIDVLKDKLEISNESIKAYNKVDNPYFDKEFEGYTNCKTEGNVTEIRKENNNNYLHMEAYKTSGDTQYTYLLKEVVSNYGEIIYLNMKYRNTAVNNTEDFLLYNPIVELMRGGNGYGQNVVTSTEFVNNYNKGWKHASVTREILEKTGTYFIQLSLGGGRGARTTWEFLADFDDIYIINLTEIFGAGNEPTKEQMDEIFNNF